MSFTITPGFHEDERSTAARLYWQAFGAKLGAVLGPEERARAFLERVLDPRFALVARDDAGRVLALAGVKTAGGALVGGEWRDLVAVYGWPGALWRAGLLATLERGLEPGVLQMDGIFVARHARGSGVGGQLLEAVARMAADGGQRVVRLDVIDSNPRARALYAREGFVPVSRSHTGPLRHVFGFRSALRMERPV
jgi:GNAT superfamily N-acetyltransferase